MTDNLGCEALYDKTYADFVKNGYSTTEAAAAAQEAFAACLNRQQVVAPPSIQVPGGRQFDPGPTGKQNNPTNLGKGRKS